MSKWLGCPVINCQNDLCHNECRALSDRYEKAAKAWALHSSEHRQLRLQYDASLVVLRRLDRELTYAWQKLLESRK